MKLSPDNQPETTFPYNKAKSLVWLKSRYVCTLTYAPHKGHNKNTAKVCRRSYEVSTRFITMLSSFSRGLMTQQSMLYLAGKFPCSSLSTLWSRILLKLSNLFNLAINLNSIALYSLLLFKPVSRFRQTQLPFGSAKKSQPFCMFTIENIKRL